MDIGQKLKELRIQAGLTQEELAERSDLTKGFISQVERNLTSPSMTTFFDILAALGKEPSEFFNGMSKDKYVFKIEEQVESNNEEFGYSLTWIVPTSQKNLMEPIVLRLSPSGKTKAVPPFEGEVLGYLIEGDCVFLNYGEDKSEIKKGECFYISADREHYIENLGDDKAVLLWISAPPHF